MGVTDNDPFLRGGGNLLMAYSLCFSLHHIANIDFIRKDFYECPCLPVPAPHQTAGFDQAAFYQVKAGGDDTLLI